MLLRPPEFMSKSTMLSPSSQLWYSQRRHVRDPHSWGGSAYLEANVESIFELRLDLLMLDVE